MPSTGTHRRPRAPVCPVCRYDDQVVPIAYGLPTSAIIEQSKRGDVALGGYCPPLDPHQWYCKGCLHPFSAPHFPEFVEKVG